MPGGASPPDGVTDRGAAAAGRTGDGCREDLDDVETASCEAGFGLGCRDAARSPVVAGSSRVEVAERRAFFTEGRYPS